MNTGKWIVFRADGATIDNIIVADEDFIAAQKLDAIELAPGDSCSPGDSCTDRKARVFARVDPTIAKQAEERIADLEARNEELAAKIDAILTAVPAAAEAVAAADAIAEKP